METKRPNHRPNKVLKTDQVLTDEFYTILEVAKLYKVHHNTIRKAIRENRLPAICVCNKWLIKKEDINKLQDREG